HVRALGDRVGRLVTRLDRRSDGVRQLRHIQSVPNALLDRNYIPSPRQPPPATPPNLGWFPSSGRPRFPVAPSRRTRHPVPSHVPGEPGNTADPAPVFQG